MPKIYKDRATNARATVGVPRATSRPVGGSPSTGGRVAESEPAASSTPTPPAPSAPKADWVAYAEALGEDPTGLTKADLVELLG